MVAVLVVVLAAVPTRAERTGPMSAFFARLALAVERGEPETHTLLEEALDAWLADGTRLAPASCASPVCLPAGAPCDPNATDRLCTVDTCLDPISLSLSLDTFTYTAHLTTTNPLHSLPRGTGDP